MIFLLYKIMYRKRQVSFCQKIAQIYLSCKKKNHIVIATSDQRLTMGVLTLCKNYYILLSRKIY
jgi:hypothetical protein